MRPRPARRRNKLGNLTSHLENDLRRHRNTPSQPEGTSQSSTERNRTSRSRSGGAQSLRGRGERKGRRVGHTGRRRATLTVASQAHTSKITRLAQTGVLGSQVDERPSTVYNSERSNAMMMKRKGWTPKRGTKVQLASPKYSKYRLSKKQSQTQPWLEPTRDSPPGSTRSSRGASSRASASSGRREGQMPGASTRSSTGQGSHQGSGGLCGRAVQPGDPGLPRDNGRRARR